METIGPFNSGNAVGSAGNAVADQDSPVRIQGMLEGLYVKYNPAYPDNPPSTTKVTITTKGANGAAPSLTLLTLDGANTDGWFFPRVLIHDTAGVASTTLYDRLPIDDVINVAIESADEDNNVDVYLAVS